MNKRRNDLADSDDSDDDTQSSHPSAASAFGDGEPSQKRAKIESTTIVAFNKRYKVESRTNEEVLGAYEHFDNH